MLPRFVHRRVPWFREPFLRYPVWRWRIYFQINFCHLLHRFSRDLRSVIHEPIIFTCKFKSNLLKCVDYKYLNYSMEFVIEFSLRLIAFFIRSFTALKLLATIKIPSRSRMRCSTIDDFNYNWIIIKLFESKKEENKKKTAAAAYY